MLSIWQILNLLFHSAAASYAPTLISIAYTPATSVSVILFDLASGVHDVTPPANVYATSPSAIASGTKLATSSANAALIFVNAGTAVTLAGILSVSQSSNLEASAASHVMKFSLFAAMIGAAFSYPAQLIV